MERIVVAVKPGADQPWLADAAVSIAQQTGAELAVVSLDGLEMEAFSTLPRSELTEQAQAAADAVAERIRAAGVSATAESRPGPAVRGILTYAEEKEADLILVGASSRGPVASRFFGSVPMSLVQRSRRPVVFLTHPHSPSAPTPTS